MQGIGAVRRRTIIFAVISVLFIGVLVSADQLTKLYFGNLLKNGGTEVVIKDFFFFTYTLNTGSAYGFLQDAEWAQTFFLILTPISVALFGYFYIFAYKKGYKTLLVALALVIGGAVGNYIDRAAYRAVTDFICIEIGGNAIFGVFNVADVELTAGVILVVVHLCFLDKNAIFRKTDKQSAAESANNQVVVKADSSENSEKTKDNRSDSDIKDGKEV